MHTRTHTHTHSNTLTHTHAHAYTLTRTAHKAFAIFIASVGDEASEIKETLPSGVGNVCLDTAQLPHLLSGLFMQNLLPADDG